MCVLVLSSRPPRWSATHREEEGGDGSAAVDVDHGQEAGQVALPGAGEEQPGGENEAPENNPFVFGAAASREGCRLGQ